MPNKGEGKINNRHSKIVNQPRIGAVVCEENQQFFGGVKVGGKM